MTATWTIDDNRLGLPDIDATSTTQAVPLGTVVQAHHATYGAAKFVYLQGVASTAAGDVVTYAAGLTTRNPATGGIGMVAVAMSANVASQYGWYAVQGCVKANTAGTVAAGAAVYAAGTGTVDDATSAGELISNAYFAESVTGAGQALVQIGYPSIS